MRKSSTIRYPTSTELIQNTQKAGLDFGLELNLRKISYHPKTFMKQLKLLRML